MSIAGLISLNTRFTAAVISLSGSVDRIRNWPRDGGWGSWALARNAIGPKFSRKSLYFVSFATPTISNDDCGSLGVVSIQNRRPIGLAPFNNLRARISLTMATLGVLAASRSSKSRPARRGLRRVAK